MTNEMNRIRRCCVSVITIFQHIVPILTSICYDKRVSVESSQVHFFFQPLSFFLKAGSCREKNIMGWLK